MKSINTVGLILTLAVATTTAYAGSVCEYLPGKVVCGKGQVSNVTGAGMATLNGTTVTDQVKVAGKLNATSANLNNISEYGSADISNSSVKGTYHNDGGAKLDHTEVTGSFSIAGLLVSRNSTFSHPMIIASNLTQLIASKTSSITVTQSGDRNEKVYLQSGTTVDGNIVFESKTGTVIESDGSTVTGQVIGGTVVHQ